MPSLTFAYVVTLVVATILFDIYVYCRGGWESTISYLVLTRASRYPIISFAVGVVIGHLFWPQPMPPEQRDELSDPEDAGRPK